MRIVSLSEFDGPRNSVITIGNFDGVHLGHQAILKTVTEDSRELGAESAVLTFGDHPRKIIQGDEVPLLTTLEQRTEIFDGLGIDTVIIADQKRIFEHDPREFIDRILVETLRVKEVVVGYDFHFGKNRAGNNALLLAEAGSGGFLVKTVDPVKYDSENISSSRIRALLAEGWVREANACLGRPYEIRGAVVKGEGRGQTLGFPTANIAPDVEPAIGYGIYAGTVRIPGEPALESGPMKALASYGTKPTFHFEGGATLEALIPGFEGNLYGQRIHLALERKIRAQQKFSGAPELIDAINEDIRSLSGS